MLPPFKARQVHGIRADEKIFTEPLGCLTCLYSQVGKPRMLKAMCPSSEKPLPAEVLETKKAGESQ